MNPAQQLQAFVDRNEELKKVRDSKTIPDASKKSIWESIINLLRGMAWAFSTHKTTDVFFVTVDSMPFWNSNDAWNHARSLKELEVYEVHRADIAALEGVLLDENQHGKTIEDYKGAIWTANALIEELKKREIPHEPKAKKQVFIDLLTADDISKAATSGESGPESEDYKSDTWTKEELIRELTERQILHDPEALNEDLIALLVANDAGEE